MKAGLATKLRKMKRSKYRADMACKDLGIENRRLRELLRHAAPFVRCVNEPCECGRDALYEEIQAATVSLGQKGDRTE